MCQASRAPTPLPRLPTRPLAHLLKVGQLEVRPRRAARHQRRRPAGTGGAAAARRERVERGAAAAAAAAVAAAAVGLEAALARPRLGFGGGARAPAKTQR
jgi:hypothetical protein